MEIDRLKQLSGIQLNEAKVRNVNVVEDPADLLTSKDRTDMENSDKSIEEFLASKSKELKLDLQPLFKKFKIAAGQYNSEWTVWNYSGKTFFHEVGESYNAGLQGAKGTFSPVELAASYFKEQLLNMNETDEDYDLIEFFVFKLSKS